MDYYEELGVPRYASPEQIRQGWRSLARLLHPDQQQDEALRAVAEREMKRLNGICAVLTDPASRIAYDRALAGPARRVWRKEAWMAAAGCAALAGVLIYTISLPSPNPRVSSAPPSIAPASTSDFLPKQRVRRPRASPVRPPETSTVPGTDRSVHSASLQDRVVSPQDPPDAAAANASVDSDQPPIAQAGTSDPGAVPAVTVSQPNPASAPGTETPASGADAAAGPQVPWRAFAGAWIYVQPKFSTPGARLLYPPEFIELFIAARDGTLRGRYRARYKVEDRAISPDVLFAFEGPAGTSTLPWTGAGDASGEVSLRLRSPDTLEVSWKATRLGPALSLASGTAVLTRRLEQQ